jgi:hypothetical protein
MAMVMQLYPHIFMTAFALPEPSGSSLREFVKRPGEPLRLLRVARYHRLGDVVSCNLEPRLTRYGYDVKSIAEEFHIKPADVRLFLQGQLDPARSRELTEQMRLGWPASTIDSTAPPSATHAALCCRLL